MKKEYKNKKCFVPTENDPEKIIYNTSFRNERKKGGK